MSDTLSLDIPRKQWVNLYTETSIPVGTSVKIINQGHTIYIDVQDAEPTSVSNSITLLFTHQHIINTGSNNVWIYSISGSRIIYEM